MADNTKVIIAEKNGVELEFHEEYELKAGNIPYDNTDSGLIATDVKEGIDEIAAGGGTGASPGFSFGRSGNIAAGAYLLNEAVPSNKSGRPLDLSNPRLTKVSVRSEIGTADTYTIAIEEYNGTTFTEIATVPIVSNRKGSGTFSINLTTGNELAVKVKSGSCKNPIVIVYVKGDAD